MFIEVLLEAKGKKISKKPKAIDLETEDTEDYGVDNETTEEEEPEEEETDSEETTGEEDDADQVTDYADTNDTEFDETEEELEAEGGEENVEDDTATDYTSDETDDDSATDYTDDETTDGDEFSNDNEGGETTGEEEQPEEISQESKIKNKGLLEDCIKLKEILENFHTKVTNINSSTLNKNRLFAEVGENLNILNKQLNNYIIFKFSKNEYVKNLYFYNFIIEALNINIKMVGKIGGFDQNI